MRSVEERPDRYFRCNLDGEGEFIFYCNLSDPRVFHCVDHSTKGNEMSTDEALSIIGKDPKAVQHLITKIMELSPPPEKAA